MPAEAEWEDSVRRRAWEGREGEEQERSRRVDTFKLSFIFFLIFFKIYK